MLIGNSFALTDYAWNIGRRFPRCVVVANVRRLHFFLVCDQYHDIRPEDIDSWNLLDPEDCNIIIDYVSHSTKLNGNV